jgi:hypothetical protein
MFEVDGSEVLAVAAVLPQDVRRATSFALEVDFAEEVAAILTLDRALARSEETSLVFGTEYSHFRCSLYGWVIV